LEELLAQDVFYSMLLMYNSLPGRIQALPVIIPIRHSVISC